MGKERGEFTRPEKNKRKESARQCRSGEGETACASCRWGRRDERRGLSEAGGGREKESMPHPMSGRLDLFRPRKWGKTGWKKEERDALRAYLERKKKRKVKYIAAASRRNSNVCLGGGGGGWKKKEEEG